jgi:NADH:ubiquinone oxidoreductase subunit 6 (subunit J)
MQLLETGVSILVALLLLTWIGNVVCRQLFSVTGLTDVKGEESTEIKPAGWIIGWLERLVFAVGIITHS